MNKKMLMLGNLRKKKNMKKNLPHNKMYKECNSNVIYLKM